MSYLDHIKHCNSFSAANYIPFIIDNEQLGWTKKIFAELLLKYNSVFELNNDCLTFKPHLNTPELKTQAVRPVLEDLHHQGVIDTWVGETYAITNNFEDEPHFLMERAAVSYFGVRGYGVHVNGLVEKADGIYIWIARRTRTKPFWPGKLDQMVAGGQPFGIGLMENVIKESAEEASVPEAIASTAKYVGELHYTGENKRGMNIDTLFNYDLCLTEDFVPVNTDGEVDEFILMSLEEMAEIIDTSNEFKDNCNLVNIDLLIRKGIIDQSHPEFEAIKNYLYAPASLADI